MKIKCFTLFTVLFESKKNRFASKIVKYTFTEPRTVLEIVSILFVCQLFTSWLLVSNLFAVGKYVK